eukprot:TRINITY_DN34360_c0_g2_i1.p1 TRINITY_DN34360_c0_g2~~TRINITY_DN34360_c0_g2_i1.p1  ORF type:complete len:267 (+),score=37.08 TRINITY_DN34360_c0_g2_i1:106-801(+)
MLSSLCAVRLRPRLPFAAKMSSTRRFSSSPFLWAPGASSTDLDASTRKLAGRIALTCRGEGGQNKCEVAAKGTIPTSRALLALAQASQLHLSTIEFSTRWQTDDDGQRHLRFVARQGQSWAAFKAGATLNATGKKAEMLVVTPSSNVAALSRAAISVLAKSGRGRFRLNARNEIVLCVAAKVLATLEGMVRSERVGQRLHCVASQTQDGGLVYVEIFTGAAEASNGEVREE